MSLYGALISGVSGLNANSTAMGIISDNITNVNTVGYKGTGTNFSSLVTETGNANSYSPGGVRATPQYMIDRQGILQATSSATDLAISGDGFFTVTQTPNQAATGQVYYTRAGSFTADRNGDLVNSAGYFLQGIPADPQGNFPANIAANTALRTVNISSLTGSPVATTSVALKANLQASQTVNTAAATYAAGDMATQSNTGTGGVAPDFERSVQVYDSLGTSHTISIGFLKSATANTWSYEVYSNPAAATTGTNGLIASGTVTFDSSGNLLTPATSPTVTVNWAGSGSAVPVTPQSITLDFGTVGTRGGLGQVDAPSTLFSSTADGNSIGNLTGINVKPDGVVEARFSNGVTRPVYRLAVATFPNANGLSAMNGNVYQQTLDSGDASLNYAGIGVSGTIAANSLEGSTVDLAKEFTNMITTQRAYSASSKIITTADEMLSELIQIKR
jgi:flagellar hook protein FlgE